ncbi:hypothetical protein CTI12_AA104390 [Artemisia annua]|uniref:GBF-interacting protein 1 N-terminal domain-containing protein n=1 Tax=Artemisia annua TaxID=35608 RepID=A0A2U1PWD6_ARTAN|nr:hypothetical protein CTI12_AA104390 [Artemisia annua]
MTTTNTSCEVSIPSNRFLNKIRKTAGLGRYKNLFNDDIIKTILKDCNMDETETCRRLTMIHEVKVAVDITNSVDEVYTMLKECNMDQTETCRKLKMIQDIRVVASTYSVDDVYTVLKECNMDQSEATQRLLYIDTFQEVKKKKDTPKSVSDGDTVQEVEKKTDTPKTVSNGDTVQEVEPKSVSNGDTVQEVEPKSVSNGDTVQEVEPKSVSNGDTVQEVEPKSVSNADTVQEVEPKSVSNTDTVQEVEKEKDTPKSVSDDTVHSTDNAMTTTNTSCEVSIRPTKNFFNKIRKTAGLGRCRDLFNDDIIYTILKDCNMDQTETCRRLMMIQDIRVVVDIKNSVDDVYTMLKECNMDPSEARQRLLYTGMILPKSVSDGDTLQEVEQKKDSPKSVSDGDTVQEVEQKKDTPKSASDGDIVQEVEQKKDTPKSASDTVQEIEKNKDTPKSVSDGDTVLSTNIAMTTTNTSCEVSIPSNRFLNKIRKTAGLGRCKNLFNDDIIKTILKDCNMDQTETCRRLTMIQDIRLVHDIKNSVDDVYKMLKECNMDPSEATPRLLYTDTIQEVEKNKDTPKTVSDGDTVQEVEKKNDTQKTVSNGDNVQEVEQKKDTQQKSVAKLNNQCRGASQGNFYPSKVNNDAGRRNLTSGKEYGVTNNNVKKVWKPTLPVDSRKESNNNVTKVWRPRMPVDSRKESNGAHMATSAAYVNGKLAISNGSHSHKLVPKLSSVTVSKNTTASAINTQSASNELLVKLSSPKLDVMQKKLPVSSGQSVIFPEHIHVPENCKSEFVFGSLAATRPTKPSLSCTAKSGPRGLN